MRHIYQTFSEIAEDFTDGYTWTHRMSDHTPDECFGWQHGVQEFAKWLDTAGVKLIENPVAYEALWDATRTYRPEHLSGHPEHSVETQADKQPGA